MYIGTTDFSTKVQKAIQWEKNRLFNENSVPDAGAIKYPNAKKKIKGEELQSISHAIHKN